MSDYQRCKICGEWGWFGKHACPPEWGWRTDDTHSEDDWSTVYARDAEEAAEKAAEAYDEGDHPLLDTRRSQPHVVIYLRNVRGDITRWRATAELIPQYHAEHIEPETETV